MDLMIRTGTVRRCWNIKLHAYKENYWSITWTSLNFYQNPVHLIFSQDMRLIYIYTFINIWKESSPEETNAKKFCNRTKNGENLTDLKKSANIHIK